MIRFTDMAIPALALLAATLLNTVAPSALAQNTAPKGAQDAPGAPPANRITGIETNRDMIAAEAPTEIVINGSAVALCGLVVEFGDGTKSANVISESSPFPLHLTHTYPKIDDVVVRVSGAGEGTAPPCEGALEVAVHVSPAGSKIEYITLTTGCPEGWLLKGVISADKSFRCAPIPDASAPTNLIHCIDGMKYFASDGHVGCRHPLAAMLEKFAKATTPMAKAKAKAKGPSEGGESMAKAKTPPVAKAQGTATPKASAKPKVQPVIKSGAAPN